MHLIQTCKQVLASETWAARLLFGLTLIVGIAYIWQVNVAATAGYAMRDLEHEIASLEQETERLELKISRLQSIDSVTTRMQMLGMVKAQEVEYVNAGHSAVAFDR